MSGIAHPENCAGPHERHLLDRLVLLTCGSSGLRYWYRRCTTVIDGAQCENVAEDHGPTCGEHRPPVAW